MPDDELAALREASRDLLYPSESDEPFEGFRWKAQGQEDHHGAVSARVRGGSQAQISETPLEKFFDELRDSDDVERYRQLHRVLQEHLRDVKVLRVGATEVDVFIIGKSHSGDWVGLHTTSVETG